MTSKEGLISVFSWVSDFYVNWVEGVPGRERVPVNVKGKIEPTFA